MNHGSRLEFSLSWFAPTINDQQRTRVSHTFVSTSFPGSLILLPSGASEERGGKMRDHGNEVAFVFVYTREFLRQNLFGACRKNEITEYKKDKGHTFRNITYSKAMKIRLTTQ